MAKRLAGISNSAVWLQHLEQVHCHTKACTLVDAATPQHTADNKGTASPVKLQLVAARQVGNATRHLSASPAITRPPLASACIAAKATVSDATGHPHQSVVACCNIDTHHCEARSQQQGTCVARAASHLEPLAAPFTAANLLSLHTAPAVSSSRQEVAKSGLGDVHRHQHGSQNSPAGSYSMQTSGSSRPPWDSSSQGTQSLKCSVSIGRPEDASGGDTDSPHAVHRSVKMSSALGHSSYSTLFALF